MFSTLFFLLSLAISLLSSYNAICSTLFFGLRNHIIKLRNHNTIPLAWLFFCELFFREGVARIVKIIKKNIRRRENVFITSTGIAKAFVLKIEWKLSSRFIIYFKTTSHINLNYWAPAISATCMWDESLVRICHPLLLNFPLSHSLSFAFVYFEIV